VFSSSRIKRIVALDWDTRTLRVVHAIFGKRGVKIDRLLAVGIPSEVDQSDPDDMGAFVRRVLDQEGISTRHAVVDIPRDQVSLNTLKLPDNMEELPGMVEIQVAKELAFPVSEAVIDFILGHKNEDTPTVDVLVAAVRQEVRDYYRALTNAAGLRLDRIGLRSHANKIAASSLLQHAMPERVMVLDVRPALTEITVLREGILVFSRAASVMIPEEDEDDQSILSIATGATEEFDDAEPGAGARPRTNARRDAVSTLVMEVARSIESYRGTDPAASIDHLVISGDLGIEEMLAEEIQKRLDITTELYNPASTFGWEPDEGAGATGFSASLGLVLSHAETEVLHFDFLHPKRTVSETQKRLRKAPLAAAVLVLFVAAAAFGVSEFTKSDRIYLAQLKEDIAELERRESDNRDFLAFMEIVAAFDDQLVWVDVLHDIISALPSNKVLVINRIDMDQDDREVELETVTKERETPLQAIRALESFRRPGADKPRFRAVMGSQRENAGDDYPYEQQLTITVLDDGLESKGARD